jgi:hypothetical protein
MVGVCTLTTAVDGHIVITIQPWRDVSPQAEAL